MLGFVMSPNRSKGLVRITLALGLSSIVPLGGCGGDDSAPEEAAGGSSATGGSGGSGGTSTATGGTEACTPPTEPQSCSLDMVPKTTLIDFSTYVASGSWGISSNGDLTGGTSPYEGDGASPLSRAVEGSAPDAVLHVTGTIPSGSYAGFVLWFGPCVNASSVAGVDGTTTGLEIPMGGSLGGASLKVQVQTHSNYPVDVENTKGGCLFMSCDDKWSECVGPSTTVGVPASMEAVDLPWSDFVGGIPTESPGTDGSGLVGIQLQFEGCTDDAGCPIDVTFGAIVLTM